MLSDDAEGGLAAGLPDRADEELRSVVPIVHAHLLELVNRTEARLVGELPGYGDLPQLGLRASITGQFEYLLASISGTRTPPGSISPGDTGRARAEQGVPLHAVLEAYRITVAELWQDVQSAALAQGTDPAIVVGLAGEMFGRLEEVSRIAILAYQERAAELLVEREAERAATLEALFKGYLRGRDEIWRAAVRLELPLEGRFVAIVAASAGEDPLPDVYARLRRRGLGSAWRLTPDLKVGVVSLRQHDVATVLAVLEDLAEGRVGVSAVFTALADASHGVYVARLMMAAIPTGESGVRQLDDSPLAALVAASPDTSRMLIETVLGDLLALPEKARVPLVETLEHWLAAKGSVADAAQALFCHPNTVRYRINRIEEVVGVDLSDPADLAEVASAVQALKLFPL
ncbi:PucR family transcriptional regulator [Granulicoccus sp. GXG6511]|uniref:PucR family transcriptional regulator n=1 Tax=Granulicoccus sp. GXG6511 TaxID=3381351 RepID=UPI003D7CA08E